MKLAISNIAWAERDDELAAALMQEHGVDGVEIAPTIRWPSPLEVSRGELQDYRRFWNSRGIEIVAMQALLYGRSDLTIFESAEQRRATLDHLAGMARLGAALGARVLVFGSPKNRLVGDLSPAAADGIARAFFEEAGRAATDAGVVLCIEPNPEVYGCDFVTKARQGLELVAKVGSPGFGLHLDAAGMTLADDPLVSSLEDCVLALCHFHASEPQLGPLGEGGVDHATIARTLSRLNYAHRVSVEMRRPTGRDPQAELRRVLGYLRAIYGDST